MITRCAHAMANANRLALRGSSLNSGFSANRHGRRAGARVMSCTGQLGCLLQWHRHPNPTQPEDTPCAQGPSDSTRYPIWKWNDAGLWTSASAASPPSSRTISSLTRRPAPSSSLKTGEFKDGVGQDVQRIGRPKLSHHNEWTNSSWRPHAQKTLSALQQQATGTVAGHNQSSAWTSTCCTSP